MPLITRQGGGDFTTDPSIATRTGTHGTPLGPGSYPVCQKYDVDPALRASELTWHSNSAKRMPTTDFNYEVRRELHESPLHLRRTTPAGMTFNASKSSFKATGDKTGAWLYGGVFVASTTRDTPEPGAYWPKCNTHGTPNLGTVTKEPQEKGVVPLLGSSLSAPTIPPSRDPSTFRYTGCKKDTLCPGDIPQDGMTNPSLARKTVRTTNFAASDSERRLLPPPTSIDYTLPDPANPDPGTYKVRSKFTKGTEAGFRSTMPRLAKMRTSGAPGPGHYPLKGMAGTWPPPEDGPEPEPLKATAGMASTSDRPPPAWWRPNGRGPPQSTPEYLKMPGPGGPVDDPKGFDKSANLRFRGRNSGNDVVGRHFHAVHEPKLISSLRNSNGSQVCGFNSMSLRDCQKPLVKDKNAAPGDYDLDGAMGCSIMANVRSRENVGKKGAFGSSASRYEGSAFQVKESQVSPEPGAYSLDHGSLAASSQTMARFQGAATEKGQGAFKSCEPQRPMKMKTGNLHTGPGQYELIPFPGKLSYKNPHKPAKNNNEHVAFGMAHDRWDPNAYCKIGPDPGAYELGSSLASDRGLAISTDSKTYKVRRDNDVGPGTYEVRKSLLKSTFNVAGKAHARRNMSNPKEQLLDLPPAGGGSGGGLAATQARIGRVPAPEEAHRTTGSKWKPPTASTPSRPGPPRLKDAAETASTTAPSAAPPTVDAASASATAASFYSGSAGEEPPPVSTPAAAEAPPPPPPPPPQAEKEAAKEEVAAGEAEAEMKSAEAAPPQEEVAPQEAPPTEDASPEAEAAA